MLDADALNIMSTVGEWWTKAKGPLVLTPHPGEMARLTGLSIAVVQKDRLAIAEEYAARWQAVVVLKGAGTTVASPEGLTYINPTGNPGLATGGTGDLLSGMIGAFLGQGLSPLEGACLGVYMHGAAADLAAEEVGYTGMIAGDVLFRLPRVLMGKFAKVGVDSVGGRYAGSACGKTFECYRVMAVCPKVMGFRQLPNYVDRVKRRGWIVPRYGEERIRPVGGGGPGGR